MRKFKINDNVFILENNQISERRVAMVQEKATYADSKIAYSYFYYNNSNWIVMSEHDMFTSKEELVIEKLGVRISVS